MAVRVVKTEQTITDGETAPRARRAPLWDFMPMIPLADWKSGKYEIYLYRWNPLTEKKMAVEKYAEVIDPFSIKRRHGGGRFNLMMKEDGQLIYNEDFEIEGEPVVGASSPAVAPSDGRTMAADSGTTMIEAMKLISNPEIVRMQMEMFRSAALQAMELMRGSVPAAQNPLETLRAAKEILGVGSGPTQPTLLETIHLLKELGIIGSPEKKGIGELLEVVAQLKGAGLMGGSEKADWMSTLMNAAPVLASKAVEGIHEFRLASESGERAIRLQTGTIPAGSTPVIDATPPNPAPQSTAPPAAPPANAAPAAPGGTEVRGPSEEWVMLKIVEAIQTPDSIGSDLYYLLYPTAPEVIAQLAPLPREAILGLFSRHPILARVKDNPRLPKLIDEFLAFIKTMNDQAAKPVA